MRHLRLYAAQQSHRAAPREHLTRTRTRTLTLTLTLNLTVTLSLTLTLTLTQVSTGGAALRARKRRAPLGAAEGGARHEVAACAPDYPGEWHGAWEECTVMAED